MDYQYEGDVTPDIGTPPEGEPYQFFQTPPPPTGMGDSPEMGPEQGTAMGGAPTQEPGTPMGGEIPGGTGAGQGDAPEATPVSDPSAMTTAGGQPLGGENPVDPAGSAIPEAPVPSVDPMAPATPGAPEPMAEAPVDPSIVNPVDGTGQNEAVAPAVVPDQMGAEAAPIGEVTPEVKEAANKIRAIADELDPPTAGTESNPETGSSTQIAT